MLNIGSKVIYKGTIPEIPELGVGEIEYFMGEQALVFFKQPRAKLKVPVSELEAFVPEEQESEYITLERYRKAARRALDQTVAGAKQEDHLFVYALANMVINEIERDLFPEETDEL